MLTNIKDAQPLVSVIMPAYNAEAYIGQAVSSVLQQSVSDLELIVVDDRSTDRTVEILQTFAAKDPRVRVLINPENLGAAGTRNRGLDCARGKYVALLDSDDYWKPQMLETMLARAEETGADILYCSYEIVDERGKRLCRDFIVPEKTDFEKSLVRTVISCSTTVMTRRLADQYRFPLNMYHEDTALWLQILRDGATAQGVPAVLAGYRQRSDSKSAHKLFSAARRWTIYRKYLKLSFFKAFGAIVRYAYYGVLKYRRVTNPEVSGNAQ